MGVTNGFLKLSRDEFRQLEKNETAFADRARAYDESNGYLDMDKAGYELLFMLNQSIADRTLSKPLPYPNIAAVLGGGQPIFPDLDLGYGPARIVDETALKQSIAEFDALDFDTMLALAKDDEVAGLLMVDEIDEEEFREYHWGYLQSLGDFVKEAVADDMVVVRY